MTKYIGSHRHWNNAAIHDIRTQRRPDLRLGKALTVEIALHKLFTRLRHCLHQSVATQLQIVFAVFRHVALYNFLAFPAVCLLCDHIDIAHKFLILTNRQMERRHLLAILLGHIRYHLSERSIVNIHVRYKHESWQLVLLAKLPCFLRTYFHASLAGHYDDSRIRRRDSFLHFSYEIEESGRIQHIDLHPFPFDWNNRCRNGYMAFLLFFAKVTHCVPVIYFSHSGSDTGQVSHRFHQAGLTAATVPQQYHVTNLIRCVNVHFSQSSSSVIHS